MVVHVRSAVLGSIFTALVVVLLWPLAHQSAAPENTAHEGMTSREDARLTALEDGVRDLRQELARRLETYAKTEDSSAKADPIRTEEIVRPTMSDRDAIQPQILDFFRILWDASRDDGFGLHDVLARSAKCPIDKGVFDTYCAARERAREAVRQFDADNSAAIQGIVQAMAADGLTVTAENQKAFRPEHESLFNRVSLAQSTLQDTLKGIRTELELNLGNLPSGAH